jgi:pimeloyl-ACP methyl ester carboxylesterase
MRALVQKWTRTNRFIGLALVILALMFGILPMDAQPSPPSRPILFVHGWCDSAFGWASLFAANSAFWQKLPTGLYTNQTVYIVEYDSGTGTIGFWAQTNPGYGANRTLNPLVQIPAASIPPSARFFAINFYDPNPQVANPTDPAVVTDVSILNKANEISVVLRNIESITGVNKVNIIAHSMGGLDSRAYVENLASIGACYNDSNLSNSYPDYSATNCSPGSAPYRGDVANIITLDTPHAGSELATPNSELVHLGIVGTCTGYPSTNMDELLPQSLGGAGLIEGLNFDGLGVNTSIPTQNLVLECPVFSVPV